MCRRIRKACQRTSRASVLVLTAWLCASAAVAGPEGRTYYRYTNDQGVSVINHTLPPKYAQKGYEVVTASGKVVRTVDPAPSAEEAEAMRRKKELEEELARWDEELTRRYSSVEDIEATKKRKLAQVQTSIEILKGNITNLKSQIAQQHASAALAEKRGQEVSKGVLSAIAGLEQELKLTEEKLVERQAQYQEVTLKYDKDKQRFAVIQAERAGP